MLIHCSSNFTVMTIMYVNFAFLFFSSFTFLWLLPATVFFFSVDIIRLILQNSLFNNNQKFDGIISLSIYMVRLCAQRRRIFCFFKKNKRGLKVSWDGFHLHTQLKGRVFHKVGHLGIDTHTKERMMLIKSRKRNFCVSLSQTTKKTVDFC